MAKLPNGIGPSNGTPKSSSEGVKLVFSAVIGALSGYLFVISFPEVVNITNVEDPSAGITSETLLKHAWMSGNSHEDNSDSKYDEISKIYVSTKPKGAERLPPGIVVPETDLYLRRSWGEPSEDLTSQPRYLVTFTVGIPQKANIDAAVKKFSDNFTIMLFHYDGHTTEWDEFEWSRRAIHVSVGKQTKWWYAKRFLHPDVVSRYEYIFIWDEDLGVEHFNAEA
nr:unnamed protein product [Digitaria exilis]